MAKNTPETPTQPENEADKVEQSATTPEQEAQAALQAENAALQAEITALREANAALTAERDAAQAALLAAQQAASAPTQPETTPSDPRQIIEAISVSGGEFWRGGVLFNGAWQTVYRAEVGEEAWQRIVNDPRLRIKSADEYGA